MNDTQLIRLAYVSCSHLDLPGIQTILSTAHRRNPGLQITGSLIFTGQYFFQTLEGPADRVDDMFAQIRADGRHYGICPVLREPSKGRRFDAWTMGFVRLPVLDQFVAPLFVEADTDRADILSRMALQALCQKT